MSTAFTPNGDGLNDFFMPMNSHNLTFERFVIFNRWGQMVFECYDLFHGWDGTWNGVDQTLAGYATSCTVMDL